MRLAVDTGGTFTDLVVEDDEGDRRIYKSSTTPNDPIEGVLTVLDVAADDMGIGRRDLLERADLFVHGTTRAINAILTNTTPKTALLSTRGHPDVLLLREGGRTEPFNWTNPYPDPYIPRSLTYEVPERIGADGEVIHSIDEPAVRRIISELGRQKVEAIAVCLLWSIVNPVHELRIGELLDEEIPEVPYTLSHQLNPTLREYRRASATAIDASLKPIMADYLAGLEQRLREAGFSGRALVVTSGGGVLDATAIAAVPIHSLGSGPAMAPVAGRHYALLEASANTAVIADAGGTSYDVSLVRRGRIPWTRETWIGPRFYGHITGFPSVDVRSIGAGGGSIAWVDEGGLLRVGPHSAGAEPGPVCYGRGGTEPTVTDASLVLGFIDPTYFLGGTIQLDAGAAKEALQQTVCLPLGLDEHEAAAAILRLATENMVRAIEEITLNQGIDPRAAVLVAGGGAAGLNAVGIARRLGSPLVLIPDVAGVLSAAGALISDLTADYAATHITSSVGFDYDGVNSTLKKLETQCTDFAESSSAGSAPYTIEFSAEARYKHQLWELDVPLRGSHFSDPEDVERLRQDFHDVHKEVFAIDDRVSAIDILNWRARVRCRLHDSTVLKASSVGVPDNYQPSERRVFFSDTGITEANILHVGAMTVNQVLDGPAVIQSPITTVVLEPGSAAVRTPNGTIAIRPWSKGDSQFDLVGLSIGGGAE